MKPYLSILLLCLASTLTFASDLQPPVNAINYEEHEKKVIALLITTHKMQEKILERSAFLKDNRDHRSKAMIYIASLVKSQ